MTDRARVAAAFALLLAVPVVRGLFTGSIDAGSAVARVLLAVAVAWGAVGIVRSVFSHQWHLGSPDGSDAGPVTEAGLSEPGDGPGAAWEADGPSLGYVGNETTRIAGDQIAMAAEGHDS